ncbi:MAG TPA: hypothetical protein DHV85_18550 [Candidatus Accumulibacter sp.]|nr:hypothetical protein [Accumulibacter sp.]
MSIGSALAAGNEPLPRLAEEALAQALEKSGASHATSVLLFLTSDFSRHAQRTVTAVARAARCTEVAGGIAAGVFTDHGWILDRPAAAVMVFAGGLSLDHRQPAAPAGQGGAEGDDDHAGDESEQGSEPLLSYAGSSFPCAWRDLAPRRFGGSFAGSLGRRDPVAWQHSRLAWECSLRLRGAHVDLGVSTGWRLLGRPFPVDSCRDYELFSLGGKSALDSLTRALPAACRDPLQLPLASLCAVVTDGRGEGADDSWHTIAILAANADKSLTLAERTTPGQNLAWATRVPQSAEGDMRQSLSRLAGVAADPVAALVFSCIGRGACFHSGQDRELDCLRERFPGLPLIGGYGTGQIAPRAAGGNRLLHNAVVTALISMTTRRADVQSQP